MRHTLTCGVRAAMSAALLTLLAACGGGGGEPGQCVSGGPETCKASTPASGAQ